MIGIIINIHENTVLRHIAEIMKQQETIPIKITMLVIGDNGIEKFSLFQSYYGLYDQSKPNRSDWHYIKNQKLDGKFIQLGLWDTIGSEEYNRLRPLAYPNSDVIVICFSVVDRGSFLNVLKKWIPQIKQNIHIQKLTLMVVGLHTQKRKQYLQSQDQNKINKVVSEKQAKKAIEQLQESYMQCSPSTKQNVENIIHQCIRRALHKKQKPFVKKKQNKKCCLI